jgi:hypothetical protein
MNRTIGALATALLASAALLVPAAAQDHPDLSGLWANGIVPEEVYRQLDPAASLINRNARPPTERAKRSGAVNSDVVVAGEQDNALRKRGSINRPPYKPEFWPEIRLVDLYGNAGGEWMQYADPVWQNRPMGVPRIGPPSKIVQKDNFITLLYATNNVYRDIPIDCRPHNPDMSIDISYMGHAVGCWEGDTLVITSKGFTDDTWLDWPGHIHSIDMVVVEKLRRDGTTLFYDLTVIDPVMFSEPWVLDTRRLTLDERPNAILPEDPPYNDRGLGVLTYPTFRS